MSVSLKKYTEDIRNFTEELSKQLPNIVSRVGLDTLDKIEQRMTETGKSSTGEQFGAYVEGRYKDFKSGRGQQTNFVTLRLTGRMWSNINIIDIKNTLTKSTVIIGGQSQETQDKLEHNAERYDKDILSMSLEEEKQADEDIDKELTELANKFL